MNPNDTQLITVSRVEWEQMRQERDDARASLDESRTALYKTQKENRYLSAYATRTVELDKENSLKLKQILDLEDLLYSTHLISNEDGSPCWCCRFDRDGVVRKHEPKCLDAKDATIRLWKK